MADKILEIKDLRVNYQTDLETVEAVNGIDLEIEKSGTLGLVGETGAGKTTTALSIMRLLPSTTGRILNEMCIRDRYKILSLLMENAGRVFPAEEIYERVWGEMADYTVENTVMVHIRHIREKIEIDTKNPKYVKVVWGIGYKMEKYN